MNTLVRIVATATVLAMTVLLVIAIATGRSAGEITIYAVLLVLMTANSAYIVRNSRA